MEPVNAAVIYYSATGTVHALARAAAEAGVLGLHRLQHCPRRAGIHPAGAGKYLLPLGGIIVPPGYTDPVQFQSGNPYGTSHVAGDGPPGEVALQATRHQARRAVDTAASLKAGRAA